MAAQLVVEASAEHFAFRHALSQQAIYTDLLARERRTLHRDIAAAHRQLVEEFDRGAPARPRPPLRRGPDQPARGLRRLPPFRREREVPERARRRHRTVLARDRAAGHLGIAVPASMHRSRGQAYEAHGDFDAARADYETTFEMAVAAGDARAQWQALIDQGFLWAGRDYARARDFFQRAADLAVGSRVPADSGAQPQPARELARQHRRHAPGHRVAPARPRCVSRAQR